MGPDLRYTDDYVLCTTDGCSWWLPAGLGAPGISHDCEEWTGRDRLTDRARETVERTHERQPPVLYVENKWGADGKTDTRIFLHDDVAPEWFRDASPQTAADEILQKHGIERTAAELLSEL